MKNYNAVFILPGISIKYPPGGYDIVYRLANGLNKKGISTAIIFLKDNKYVPNYFDTIKKSMAYEMACVALNNIFYGKRLSYFYHCWKLLSNLFFKVDYDYKLLKNVDCYLYSKIEDIKFNTKIIFATSWETAYFVNEYVKLKGESTKACYLIQNSEDDKSFSGRNSNLAKKTYKFKFKKIVINKNLYKRFAKEKPLFFHVGIDTEFYKVMPGIEKDSVMFPLRKSKSKGAKYAIQCIKKLIKNYKQIKIITFGDFTNNEIPQSIRYKISHYYLPTRSQLRILYNKSKIFILPSLIEGMPLPPLEAMACECAVITTDNGGVNEYTANNVNCLLCPTKNSTCLYTKIVYLLKNKDKRQQLVRIGLETAKQYNYEKMINSFIKLIKRIDS